MNSLALTESKTLRDQKIADYDNDSALNAMNKAKALVMATWKNTKIATTKQLAEYFEVSEDTVQSFIKNNRGELAGDGLKILRGKDLKEVVSMIDTTSKTPSLTIWTPRAALRLGMLLRDSEVAKELRTLILNFVELAPKQVEQIESLKLQNENLKLENENLKLRNENIKLQENFMSRSEAIVTLHGVGMLALIQGRPDAVVEKKEVVTESVICVEGRRVSFVGKSTAELGKELGFKTGKDFQYWLENQGQGHLICQGMRAIQAEYVPEENIKKVREIWAKDKNGATRQLLLGE